MKKKRLSRRDMTPAQADCFDLLCDVFLGAHHVPPCYEWGTGIECSVYGDLSTYDYDKLTRLVVLAHDRAIRVAVKASGPRLVGVGLTKRQREGAIYDSHPTIEAAVAKVRKLDALGDAIERHPPGIGRGCNLCAAATHRADQAEARVAELAAALRAADAWMDECVDYIEWDHFTRGVEDRHDAARSAVAAALARLDAAGGDKGPDASAPDPS